MFHSACLLKGSLLIGVLTVSGQLFAANQINETYVANAVFSTDNFLTDKGIDIGFHGQFELSYQMHVNKLALESKDIGLREVTECAVWIDPPTYPGSDGVCGKFQTLGWAIVIKGDQFALGDYSLTVKNLGSDQVIARKSGVLYAGVSAMSLPMLSQPVLPQYITLTAFIRNPISVSAPFGPFANQSGSYPVRLDLRSIDSLGTLNVNVLNSEVSDLMWATAPGQISPYWGMYLTVHGPFSSPVDSVKVAESLGGSSVVHLIQQ